MYKKITSIEEQLCDRTTLRRVITKSVNSITIKASIIRSIKHRHWVIYVNKQTLIPTSIGITRRLLFHPKFLQSKQNFQKLNPHYLNYTKNKIKQVCEFLQQESSGRSQWRNEWTNKWQFIPASCGWWVYAKFVRIHIHVSASICIWYID